MQNSIPNTKLRIHVTQIGMQMNAEFNPKHQTSNPHVGWRWLVILTAFPDTWGPSKAELMIFHKPKDHRDMLKDGVAPCPVRFSGQKRWVGGVLSNQSIPWKHLQLVARLKIAKVHSLYSLKCGLLENPLFSSMIFPLKEPWLSTSHEVVSVLFEHNESADNAIFSYMGFPQERNWLRWGDLGLSWKSGENTQTPRICHLLISIEPVICRVYMVIHGCFLTIFKSHFQTAILLRFRNSPRGSMGQRPTWVNTEVDL